MGSLQGVSAPDFDQKIGGCRGVFCTRHHNVRHSLEREVRKIEDNGSNLANFGVMFLLHFLAADGEISWGASRGSLGPILAQNSGAVERYFAHTIITLDIVMNVK